MATNLLDLIVEKLKQQYGDIRVDHLNEDELDFELEIRDIVFNNNEPISRKRRALRETLKTEKLIDNPKKTLKQDPSLDLQLCIAKLKQIDETIGVSSKSVPPRCQSRLLHLGSRLSLLAEYTSAEESVEVARMQEAVLSRLNRYFYGKRSVLANELEDNELINLFSETGNPLEEATAPLSVLTVSPPVSSSVGNASRNFLLGQEDDIMDSLLRLGLLDPDNPEETQTGDVKKALLELEHELYLLRRFRDVHSTIQRNPTSTQAPQVTTSANNTVTSCTTTYTGTIPMRSIPTGVSTGVYPPRSLPQVSSSYPRISFSTNSTASSSMPRMVTSANVDHDFEPTSLPYVPQSASVSSVYPPVTITPTMPWGQWPSYYPAQPFGQGYPVPNTTAEQYLPPIWNQYSAPGPVPDVHRLISRVNITPSYPGPTIAAPGQAHVPPPACYPAPADFPRGNYGHKSLPVSKWKLEKYAGTDQGLKLNEFLVLVSQLALSERTSEGELFDSAFHLFTGPALNWYMTMRSSGRLASWTHLVSELRRTFAHPELDSLVRTRIYQRRQQRNETFQEYYYDMEKMFRSMIVPMGDAEQLDIVKRNMRTDYKKTLLWKPIFSLPELLEAGHVIDASNFSLYAKVFGNDKSVNAVSEFKPDKGDPKNTNNRPSFKPSHQRPNNYKPKEEHPKKKDESEGKKSTSATSSGPSRQHDPKEGPSKPTRTIETLIEAHRPPRSYECLYCRQTSHSLDQCRNYRGSLCLVCGFKGFETHNCPYCRKNGLQTVQNRGPSNPSA